MSTPPGRRQAPPQTRTATRARGIIESLVRRAQLSIRRRNAHDARIAGILDRIRDIPRGHVQTYGDIEPEAPRLVGRILATTHETNLPWHRVVRADGSIPMGERQRELLVKEGVPMRRDRVDLGRARA